MAIIEIKSDSGANIGNPPIGSYYVFLDNTNSNNLTIRDSDGSDEVFISNSGDEVFGSFSDLVTQTFIVGISTPIKFGKNNQVTGITHSETVNNSEFTFTTSGVYQMTIEPQVFRNASGGGVDLLNVWIQIDSGSGFVNNPNSNIQEALTGAHTTAIATLTETIALSAGDKVRFMAQVDNTNVELEFTAATGSPPNDIPATPSVILNIVKISI